MSNQPDLERILRAHLAGQADSRTAEGALEAVLAVTAGIRPRHSWRAAVFASIAPGRSLEPGARLTGRLIWVLVLLGLLVALAIGATLIGSQRPHPVIVVEPSEPTSSLAIANHHNGPITVSSGTGVVAIDPASGAQSPIIAGPVDYTDWAPDGRQLAIVRSARLTVLDTTTGVTTAVNPSLNIMSPIAWSPDGTRIAYLAIDGVHVVDVGSGIDTRLATLAGSLESTALAQSRLRWTPDGQTVRYATQGQTYATRVDGSGATLTTLPNTNWTWSLAWSPDGTQVAYLTDPLMNPNPGIGDPYVLQLWIAQADGSHPSKVFEQPGCCVGIFPNGPIWSPDGKELALAVGSYGLQVIDLASGRARNLGTVPAGNLGWRPVPITTTAPSSPTPIPTPSPTAAPLAYGKLVPGRYRADPVTVTLPAGWYGLMLTTGVVKPNDYPPEGLELAWWPTVGTVYRDPCHWKTTAIPVGPTLAEQVAALDTERRGSTATPIAVTIDGYLGEEIDLVVPLGVKVLNCDGGWYASLIGHVDRGPGQHDLLDILAVNGRTLVLDRSFYPANTPADLAELQAMIDSITITP